jgi:hypothetical protein
MARTKTPKKCLDKDPPFHLPSKRARGARERVRVRGFYRINIEEDGKIIGDSGWVENTVTNQGFKLYLADNIGKTSGSKQIGFVALGTGTAANVTDVTLNGEISASAARQSVVYLNVGSKTAQFTATFASSNNFLSATSNISNIGLYSATTSNDTLFSGASYASSACASNNNVNITYSIGLQ